jgi:predicted DNA-binding WGR domain protein
MRRFESTESASRTFWEIDQKGSSFTERFGSVAGSGQSRTSTFPSADEAMQAMLSLIREKIALGYREGTAGPRRTVHRPAHYSNLEHTAHFRGCPVREFIPEVGLKHLERTVYCVRTDALDGEAAFQERLDALLSDAQVGQLKGLVIGNWFGQTNESPPIEAMDRLIAAKERLGSLRGLFVGDVIQEEADISMLHQGELTSLIQALPALEELVVRGGRGLRLPQLVHPGLRTLIIQSGGLNSGCVHDLMTPQLPNLERVALWLGAESYGADFAVEDLAAACNGEIWPSLEYLGLMDSDQADGIAAAVTAGAMIRRILALDLSMGTLGDEGGRDLFSCAAVRSLSFLNLRHHYMSRSLAASFSKLGIEVDVSDRELDDDLRTCEVSE